MFGLVTMLQAGLYVLGSFPIQVSVGEFSLQKLFRLFLNDILAAYPTYYQQFVLVEAFRAD